MPFYLQCEGFQYASTSIFSAHLVASVLDGVEAGGVGRDIRDTPARDVEPPRALPLGRHVVRHRLGLPLLREVRRERREPARGNTVHRDRPEQ